MNPVHGAEREALGQKIRSALERFTADLTQQLPPHFGLMTLFYNLGTSPCDVSMVSNHTDPGEVLRILRGAARRLSNRYGGPTRVFGLPKPRGRAALHIATRDGVASPSLVIARAIMHPAGGREFLALYDAEFDEVGELSLNPGESERVATLLGLVDEIA